MKVRLSRDEQYFTHKLLFHLNLKLPFLLSLLFHCTGIKLKLTNNKPEENRQK